MGPTDDLHTETLWAPVSWWLLGAVFVLAVWWSCYVATPAWVAWCAAAVALGLVAALLVSYGRVEVSTRADGLHAGRAWLPWQYVGDVLALDAGETRRHQGVDADARAHLVMRSYCPRAVKVVVDDREDPTPYWLVSTRRPEALAASLTRHRVSD